jgi:lactoylglutathione lyase
MSQPPPVTVSPVAVSHVAACVSDLERSRRFYEALGFEVQMQVDVTAPFELLTELPEIQGRAIFFTHSTMGIRFEILHYDRPAAIGPAERRPMNQLGLTHLSFTTPDLDALGALIEGNGGQVLWHTKLEGPHGVMAFATDPDGVRLELWQKPEEA